MSEFLGWFLIAFVFLWLLGIMLNIFLPRVARIFNKVLQDASPFLPRALLPIEHTLLSLIAGGLTVLIATFPYWAPWEFIVIPSFQATFQPGVLLGAATALLALLLFAANQLQSLERDSGSGNLYLGENVNTFLARRSRIVKILALPIFHLVIFALFIVPLIWTALPSHSEAPTLGSAVPPEEWSAQLVAISFWCASFGLVSGVLLLNVLGALSNSTLGFRAPSGIRRRIEFELREISERDYAEILKGKQNLREEMYQWVAKRVDEASKLPQSEQVTYLKNTISSRKYTTHQDRAVSKCGRLITRCQAGLKESAEGKRLASWVFKWRVARVAKCLKKHLEPARGRARALLRALQRNDLTDDARNLLVAQCLAEARSSDRHLVELVGAEFFNVERPSTPNQDHFRREVLGLLFSPANRIEDLRGYGPRYSRSETAPTVATLTTFILGGLVTVLFPNTSNHGGSGSSVQMLHEILATADGLTHGPTRELALKRLISSVIDCVIVHRADAEALPFDVLTTLRRTGEEASFSSQSARKSAQLLIEEQAMDALKTGVDLQPEVRSALLKLLPQRRKPAALLYLLFHRARSSQVVTLNDLQPYYVALGGYRGASSKQRDTALKVAWRTIKESNLNHAVSPGVVKWLFYALEEPLTLGLCIEFLKTSISDLTLLQFIQWRVLASEVYHPDFGRRVLLTPKIRRQMVWAKPEIQEFAKEWRAVDYLVASKIDTLLLRFPSA